MALSESQLRRAGLLSGMVFALVQLGAFAYFAAAIFPNFAAVDAPAVDRAMAIARLGATLRLGNYLLVLPALFFFLFLGGLSSALRRLDPGADTLVVAVLAAGTAMALTWPLGAVVSDIELDLAQAGGDVATISALDAIAPYTLALSALPRTVLVGATSLLLLQLSGAARWAGRAGLVVAALSLIGTMTLLRAAAFPILASSTLLFDLWLGLVCVILLRVP